MNDPHTKLWHCACTNYQDRQIITLNSRKSNTRLCAVKSVGRGRGVVIMIENDNEPRKEVTKEAKPPGQSQKTIFYNP